MKIIIALIIAYAIIEIFLCGSEDKSRTEMKEAESINRAINNACVEFSKAAGAIAEAIRKVQE